MAISLRTSELPANSRWLGALLVLAFALYANTLFHGFVYDDGYQILQNPYVRSFKYVGKIFTTTVWSFQGQEGITNYYRPLMTFGYLLCHLAFGDLPYGYHLVNILLHVVVVWLVYAISLRLFRDYALALIAGAIFALHPVHTEVVAWIASIPEMQLAVFYLLSLLLFLRLEDAQRGRAAALHGAMLASFLFALLSKEQSLTLPLLATVYEHFFRVGHRLTPWKTQVARYAGLWLMAAVYVLFRVTLLGGFAVVLKHPDVTWPLVPLSALALTAQYVGKLLWPWPLVVMYPFQKSASLQEPRVLAGLAVLLAAAALFARLWKKSPAHAFALLWIFFTLAPVLNARWMATSVFAERYLFLPSAGLAWLVAAGILWMWRREGAGQRARRAALLLFSVGLALLAASAVFVRNLDWANDRKLFEQNVAIYPHVSLIRASLGALSWNRRDRAEAERQWRLALQDDPENPFALSNLGMAMFEQKRYAEATGFLKQVIAQRPRFAAPHVHLGNVYAAQGQKAEAETEFRRAIAIYPLSTNARTALGNFYLDEGRLPEAEAQFRASVESIPTTEAWIGLAEVYTRRNARVPAEAAWKEATQLDPFSTRAHFALGKLYLASGRFVEAEKEFRAGLLMDPNNAEALAALREISSQTKP